MNPSDSSSSVNMNIYTTMYNKDEPTMCLKHVDKIKRETMKNGFHFKTVKGMNQQFRTEMVKGRKALCKCNTTTKFIWGYIPVCSSCKHI